MIVVNAGHEAIVGATMSVSFAECACGGMHFRNEWGAMSPRLTPKAGKEGYEFERGPDGIVYVREQYLMGVEGAY